MDCKIRNSCLAITPPKRLSRYPRLQRCISFLITQSCYNFPFAYRWSWSPQSRWLSRLFGSSYPYAYRVIHIMDSARKRKSFVYYMHQALLWSWEVLGNSNFESTFCSSRAWFRRSIRNKPRRRNIKICRGLVNI